MRTIKTYFKLAPFYNALIMHYAVPNNVIWRFGIESYFEAAGAT
jgi:hypothetical protein